MQLILSVSVFWVLSIPVYGMSLYSFYGNGCKHHDGAMVNVSEDSFSILQLDGSIKTIPKSKIKSIAIYRSSENPFRSETFTKSAPIYYVSSTSNRTPFYGFVIDFYEELSLFLDTKGKIRVLEDQDIVAIRSTQKSVKFNPRVLTPAQLTPPSFKRMCKRAKQGKRIAPIRILSDDLRIEAFWQQKLKGYRRIRGIKERTSFYARPTLMDEKSRLGLIYFNQPGGTLLEEWSFFPLYFAFGGGKPYGFQSHTTLGRTSYDSLPTSLPIASAKSEFKSHILHGEIVANLSGIATGSPIISTYDVSKDLENLDFNYDSQIKHSFNHLTLLGFDYEKYSISYGYYFPIFAIAHNREVRQVLSTSTSPVIRFRYINQKSMWSVFLFNTNNKRDVDNNPDLNFSPDKSSENDPLFPYYSANVITRKMSIKNTTIRVNYSQEFDNDSRWGVTLIGEKTNYNETVDRFDSKLPESFREEFIEPGLSPSSNSLSQQRLTLSSRYQIDMGQWVALAFQINIAVESYELDFGAGQKKSDSVENFFIGEFQLLL